MQSGVACGILSSCRGGIFIKILWQHFSDYWFVSFCVRYLNFTFMKMTTIAWRCMDPTLTALRDEMY